MYTSMTKKLVIVVFNADIDKENYTFICLFY